MAASPQRLRRFFFERGAPIELLADNDTAFRSDEFQRFADKWGVRIRFRCAYAPSGNGIVERSHRTIKRTAARMNCSVAEAVYWHNATPKAGAKPESVPINRLHNYEVRVLGVDIPEAENPRPTRNPFTVGDRVWVKPDRIRCDTRYSVGTVTAVISDQAAEVDGVPRHIRDLRLAVVERASDDEEDEEEDEKDEDRPILSSWFDEEGSEPLRDVLRANSGSEPRRSDRERRPPERFGVEPWQ